MPQDKNKYYHAHSVQCRINHMAKAAYATGPALLGAPRLLSSIFSEFFCSLFQHGAPKNPSPPENVRPQNLKSKAPKSGAQNGFFPCFSVSAFSVFQRIHFPTLVKGLQKARSKNHRGQKISKFAVNC